MQPQPWAGYEAGQLASLFRHRVRIGLLMHWFFRRQVGILKLVKCALDTSSPNLAAVFWIPYSFQSVFKAATRRAQGKLWEGEHFPGILTFKAIWPCLQLHYHKGNAYVPIPERSLICHSFLRSVVQILWDLLGPFNNRPREKYAAIQALFYGRVCLYSADTRSCSLRDREICASLCNKLFPVS